MCEGCAKRTRVNKRTQLLGPSAELPVGPRNVSGVCRNGASHHADTATGAFGGAPCGASKRVRGVPDGIR
eukprot:1523843-Pyramimonas_sp.AAC.1